MTSTLASRTARPPLWRDARVLGWAGQLLVATVTLALLVWLANNVRTNSESQGIPVGFDFLDQPSSFPITDAGFSQSQPVRDAVFIGVVNTLRITVVGIAAATLLGILTGIARLSGNWLLRSAARVYVEAIRNIPLLVLVSFMYLALVLAAFPRIESAWRPFDLAVLSNRGVAIPWFDGRGWTVVGLLVLGGIVGWVLARWRRAVFDRTGTPARTGLWAGAGFVVVVLAGGSAAGIGTTVPTLEGRALDGGIRMSPEFFAILAALVIYTASHVAEIVRGSIQAVPRGQNEAAQAVALSGFQRMWFVVLPQAMRIALPPLGNQYLNLLKNSSLGATVSYFELTKVTQISVGNAKPAVPSYLLTLLIYLTLSLVLSAGTNLANRRLALVER